MNLEATRKTKHFNPLNSFIILISRNYVTVINAHETVDYLKPKEALDYVLTNAGKGHKGGHFEVAGRSDDAIEAYKNVVALFEEKPRIHVQHKALCTFTFRYTVTPYLSQIWFKDLIHDDFFSMTLNAQIDYAYNNIQNACIIKQFFLAHEVEVIDPRGRHAKDHRWAELKKARDYFQNI